MQRREVAFRNVQPHDVHLDAQETDFADAVSEEDVFFGFGRGAETGGEGGAAGCFRGRGGGGGGGGGEVDLAWEEGDFGCPRRDLLDRVVFVVGCCAVDAWRARDRDRGWRGVVVLWDCGAEGVGGGADCEEGEEGGLPGELAGGCWRMGGS